MPRSMASYQRNGCERAVAFHGARQPTRASPMGSICIRTSLPGLPAGAQTSSPNAQEFASNPLAMAPAAVPVVPPASPRPTIGAVLDHSPTVPLGSDESEEASITSEGWTRHRCRGCWSRCSLARPASCLLVPGGGFEHKWDGYRAVLYVDRGRHRLLSRRHSDYTTRVPELAPLAAELATRRAVLDGELVALTAGGRTIFQALQVRIGPRGLVGPMAHYDPPRSSLAYLLFDLMYLDGRSLLSLPYVDRRERLEELGLSGPNWWTPPYTLDGRRLLGESQTLASRGSSPRSWPAPTGRALAAASG
jgi:ATP dependent DNA ligase-like protein